MPKKEGENKWKKRRTIWIKGVKFCDIFIIHNETNGKFKLTTISSEVHLKFRVTKQFPNVLGTLIQKELKILFDFMFWLMLEFRVTPKIYHN